MPRTVKYSRSDIVNAAFELVIENGIESLSARKVGERIKSSTAPVYGHFNSMDDLRNEVIQKTLDLMLDYASRPYCDRLFLNIGTGITLFARDYKKLYHSFLMESDEYRSMVSELMDSLEKTMSNDDRFSHIPEKERSKMLQHMWYFAHGYSSLICVGLIEDPDEANVIQTLRDCGKALFGHTL